MRDDFRRHVLQFYNRSAASYELLEFIRRRTRHEAVTLSGWHPGEKVLDLCTGTGELALAFARHGAEVVGIDIARGMLRRAAGKCEHLNPAWVEMDATALSFETKSFDVSSLSLALHHMPESVQLMVLRELRRVTRRRIVIIEPHTPANPRLFALWAIVFSVLDESECMHEWVRQDFPNTCHSADLKVEFVHVTTLGLHRITLCAPGEDSKE